jgi:hypothetical protein
MSKQKKTSIEKKELIGLVQMKEWVKKQKRCNTKKKLLEYLEMEINNLGDPNDNCIIFRVDRKKAKAYLAFENNYKQKNK